MIEIFINGIKTVRSTHEIYKEFVNSKQYDFVKSGMTEDSRGVFRSWLKDNNYSLEDDRQLVEYVICKV